MRKISLFIFVLSVLFLAGCGSGNQQLNQADVLKKAGEAANKIDSYTIETNVTMNVGDIETTVNMYGDIIHNPDSMYLKMDMSMQNMSINMEAYLVDNVAYLKMFNNWLKTTPENVQLEDSFDQLNHESISKLQRFQSQFEMTEEGDLYVLKLIGEGQDYTDIVQSLLNSADVNNGTTPIDFSINELEIVVKVDKSSFMIMSQVIKAELESRGEVLTVVGETTVTNVNNVSPIQVPDEVKEKASSIGG